jgi:hypothetical protein
MVKGETKQTSLLANLNRIRSILPPKARGVVTSVTPGSSPFNRRMHTLPPGTAEQQSVFQDNRSKLPLRPLLHSSVSIPCYVTSLPLYMMLLVEEVECLS